jgi:hypothetical protein
VAHAIPTKDFGAATYLEAAAAMSSPDVKPGTYVIHRDANDPAGLDRWDTWYDNSVPCWREMYWGDAAQLGTRYDLVNRDNLRGVGFWTLNYAGGAAELWNALEAHFGTCANAGVIAVPGSPEPVGRQVQVRATSRNCPDPLYQFWALGPGASTWQMVQPYSASATLTWNNPGLVPGTYRVAVWARDANSVGTSGNALGRWDASNASLLFNVTTCSAVSESTLPASAGVGAAVAVTAHSSGCPNPNPLYQFWVLPPGASNYQMVQAYTTSATLTWNTAGLVPGTYRLGVWVEDANSGGAAGNVLGRWDVSNSFLTFKLTTCSAVSESASPPSAGVGAAITLMAHASGCPDANPLYQFWVLGPGASNYQILAAYSPNATYTWDTTGRIPGTYRIGVWAQDAKSGGAFGNSLGRLDASSSSALVTLTSCSAVSESASPASAGAGTAITLTAHASGCPDANPLYQFWVLGPGASNYQILAAYSPNATYTWDTTGRIPGTYRIGVWAQDAKSGGAFGNSLGRLDASSNSALVTLN